MTAETFIREFGHLANAPNGPKKLREMILQLAVQGRLVPQDPSDEPASVLLEKIAAEKERLVKEGKIPSLRARVRVIENIAEEFGHELPRGWVWARLGDLGLAQTGTTPPSKDRSNYGEHIPFIGPGKITNGNIDYSGEGLSEVGLLKGRLIKKNSVLMVCIGGSIGKHAVNDRDIACNQQINTLTPFSTVPVRFIYWSMATNTFQEALFGRASGSATPIINKQKWSSIPIPLPPVAEQHRFVSKVDELMRLCDEMEGRQREKNEKRIALNSSCLNALLSVKTVRPSNGNAKRIFNNFNMLYDNPGNVSELRKAILQLAVQGRLVPQDSRDEPASVLLEKIGAEKERLVKEGKIKKGKPLLPIGFDEVPYELPVGWVWARLGDCISLISGQHLKPLEYNSDRVGIPYLTGPAEFGEKTPSPTRWTILRKAVAVEGDILLTVKGSGVGKINYIENGEIAISRQLMAIRSILLRNMYVRIYLRSKETSLQDKKTGIAIPGIGRDDVNNLLVPVPPFAEQERVVAKVDDLMRLCDELEDDLGLLGNNAARLTEAFAHRICIQIEEAV